MRFCVFTAPRDLSADDLSREARIALGTDLAPLHTGLTFASLDDAYERLVRWSASRALVATYRPPAGAPLWVVGRWRPTRSFAS